MSILALLIQAAPVLANPIEANAIGSSDRYVIVGYVNTDYIEGE